MIPVRETETGFEVISGNPTLTSLDGDEFAPLAVLLHESWTNEDRARFGVYLAGPFVTPEGKVITGNERFEWEGDTLVQLFDVSDPPPIPLEDIDRIAMRSGQEVAIRKLVGQLILDEDLTDDERAALVGVYPSWTVGESVAVGDRRRVGTDLYQCVQAHTTQADWHPADTPALWNSVFAPDTIGPWIQPAGAHDAYQVGAIVSHNGQNWICTAANNVWEPGVFGWEIYQ